jgi:DNA-binding NarL/FixJ family response regulator
MEKINVLLVDDQLLFVESLRVVLEKMVNDIEVVGIAHDGQQAIKLASSLHPDVILMDVRMPGLNGVESTRVIKGQFPEIRVLMLTTFDDDEYVIEALNCGAVGYMLKNVPPAELVAAIRAVYEGNVLIASKVATNLVKKLVNPKSGDGEAKAAAPDWLNELSNREKEILSLIGQGHDNKEIAKKLYIGEQTVRNYVSIIYYKLGVRDRVLVAQMANKAGLI